MAVNHAHHQRSVFTSFHARCSITLWCCSLMTLALAILNGVRVSAQTLVDDGDSRTITPWAGPDLLKNPVSFCMDPLGRVYVAESYRAGQAVTDTRQLTQLNGVLEDLKLRSVEDRRALIQKWIDAGAFPKDYFTATEDRVKLVEDTDGDGSADHATVFAGGFNDAVDGIGAGVVFRDGSLYYTCIPNLWKLTDTDGDGTADKRQSLAYGFGVRWCFYGHDLHGLTNGPDGRLYFSMGDRGFNITTKEGKHLVGVDRGGVFRCWPDGSGLELFYQGLRNPQELTFDAYGNLFTGDNNSDSGDKSRVVYIAEGGDSGWRQNVQSLPSRGPFNREHIWELPGPDPTDPSRPAWTLPPIAHVGAGPSGIASYPGTGESHAYDDTIFLVDFYGSGSTIHNFRMVADGAGFHIADLHDYYKGTTVTDIAFGPDSRLYASDWGEGWGPNNKGNIFTITNTTVRNDPLGQRQIQEVNTLITEGFAQRSNTELLGLLAHRDQRIRQGSQFELAARGARPNTNIVEPLERLAHDHRSPLLARIHAIWALGQIARSRPDAARGLNDLLNDAHEQIRIQTISTLGDLHQGTAQDFIAALADPSNAVKAKAAVALGKLDDARALKPMLAALDANADHDVFLRHALVYGLSLINQPDTMLKASIGQSRAVRMGVLLALRRLHDPGLVYFLVDPDPGIAIEAARAIYDLPIKVGLPLLADQIADPIDDAKRIEPFLRRAIEANVLLGKPKNATNLAMFASKADIPASWKQLALTRLINWDSPLVREGVWGNLVELPGRDLAPAREDILTQIEALKDAANGNADLLALIDTLGAKLISPTDLATTLHTLTDPNTDERVRLTLLEQTAEQQPESIAELTTQLLDASDEHTTPKLRMRARELLAKNEPHHALPSLEDAIHAKSLAERQHAIALIASLDLPQARQRITALATQLHDGNLDPTIALEVFQAALNMPADSAARAAIEPIIEAQAGRSPGFETPLLLAGGSPTQGRDIFINHPSAQCIRCHTVASFGGNAGPDLTTVASRQTLPTLVESVVEPAARAAPGFGAVSAMPPMQTLLTPHEARDAIAYLATLIDPSIGPAKEDTPQATPSTVPHEKPSTPPQPQTTPSSQDQTTTAPTQSPSAQPASPQQTKRKQRLATVPLMLGVVVSVLVLWVIVKSATVLARFIASIRRND